MQTFAFIQGISVKLSHMYIVNDIRSEIEKCLTFLQSCHLTTHKEVVKCKIVWNSSHDIREHQFTFDYFGRVNKYNEITEGESCVLAWEIVNGTLIAHVFIDPLFAEYFMQQNIQWQSAMDLL